MGELSKAQNIYERHSSRHRSFSPTPGIFPRKTPEMNEKTFMTIDPGTLNLNYAINILSEFLTREYFG